MAVSTSKLALIVVLVIAGLYLLIDHTDPIPLNHEAVGLGTNHMMHSAFGVVLLVIGSFVWWRGKGKKKK